MIRLAANIIRNDLKGFGDYGVSRGDRKHRGIDLLCLPNMEIKATQPMEFIRIKRPYEGWNGGLWKVGDYELTIFYCDPLPMTHFAVGDCIAVTQNIAKRYDEFMMPHIHVEVTKDGKRINPKTVISIS